MFKRLDEKLDQLLVKVTEVQKDVSRNTDDVAEHIRRTNILETKLLKKTSELEKRQRAIVTASVFIAGAASVYYWPQVSTLLKFFI